MAASWHYSREAGSEDERLREAVLERALKAVDAAAEIVAASEVIVSVSSHLRAGLLTSRCAWCGRYRLGDGRWMNVGPTVMIEMAETTHGICDDCVAALRAAGLSV